MKVAITGATGFIGQNLVQGLISKSDQLILIGRDIEKLRSKFSQNEQVIDFRETSYSKDLNLNLKGADALVHLSGLRWWKGKLLQDYLVDNVIPTDNLFAAALNNSIDHIVFASSIAVYNSHINVLPYTEDNDCFPETHYGVSKLCCEKIAGYYNSQFGMKIKSLRIGQVVGENERDGFMLSEFLNKAKVGQALTIFGEGVGTRDYVYILDVISAILLALAHPAAAGIYNISLGKPVTSLQLAESINHAFGNSGNIVFAPNQAEEKSCRWMSCERAKRELNWLPNWDLDQMFAELASKYKNQ